MSQKGPYPLQVYSQEAKIEPLIVDCSWVVIEYILQHVFREYSYFLEKSGRKLDGSNVFMVGFAFKGPETSDMRDSPKLDLVKLLSSAGVNIIGFDPVVKPEYLDQVEGVQSISIEYGFKDVDAVFVMNNHPSYEDRNLYFLLGAMNPPGLFMDGWSTLRVDEVAREDGISYSTVSKDWWK